MNESNDRCPYCHNMVTDLCDCEDETPTDAELAEQPCQFPNCGCPEARLCMGKGGPNSGAYALINRPSKVYNS